MTDQAVDLSRYYNGVFTKEGSKDTWLQTFSGKKVSVLNPQIDTIDIDDISNAISKLCRFNGHCSEFYSVAQHCVLGTQFAMDHFDEDTAREFLIHDATEEYVGDMIRPLKIHNPVFETIENRFWSAISRRINVPIEMTPDCKYIDDVMVTWEKRDLLPNSEPWPRLPDITHFNLPKLSSWSINKSRGLFKEYFERLF